jgi:hypothetical protein
MLWVAIIGILLFLGALPLGVYVVYNSSGASLYILLGPVRISVANKNKKKKCKKQEAKPADATFSSHESQKKKKQSVSLRAYLPLLKPVFKFLVDFRTKLRVSNLKFKVVLAGADPCDLSVNYGRTWAAVGNLMPHLERYFIIKNREIEIECDYTSDKTTVDASMCLTMSVSRILQIVVYHGVSILREYLKILKNAKDGAIL